MKKLDKGLWMTALTLVVAITFLAGCAPSGGTTTSTAEQPGVVNHSQIRLGYKEALRKFESVFSNIEGL